MIKTFIKLILISRPVSWVNTAFPFAAGYIVTGGDSVLLLALGSLYFLLPYNLFMYGINDVFDYESDILNPRKGGVEGMKEQKAFHPTIIKAVIISNLPFLIYLFAEGNPLSNLILVLVIFLVAAYSVAGLRFKEIPFIDSMTSSMHFVGPLLYAVAITGFWAESLPYLIAFFLWGMASHAFGAVQDIKPDRKGGIYSIATVLGAKTTVRISFILYALASIITIYQGGVAIVVGLAGLIYLINIYPYINTDDKKSNLTNVAWKRFMVINYFVGAIVTMALVFVYIS